MSSSPVSPLPSHRLYRVSSAARSEMVSRRGGERTRQGPRSAPLIRNQKGWIRKAGYSGNLRGENAAGFQMDIASGGQPTGYAAPLNPAPSAFHAVGAFQNPAVNPATPMPHHGSVRPAIRPNTRTYRAVEII